jgi:hypothetical protein
MNGVSIVKSFDKKISITFYDEARACTICIA